MQITLTYTDGLVENFETDTYMSLGDRIAFERRFGVPAAKVSLAAKRIEGQLDDGELRADADPDAFELREEWLTYFAWRAAQRDLGSLPEFDAWVETLADWTPGSEDARGAEEEEEVAPAVPTTSGAPSA
jgi:hypothetical protein